MSESYQVQAKRTQVDPRDILERFYNLPVPVQCKALVLLHGVIGSLGELGELAGNLERWLWYGREFDQENFIEELGDDQWYKAALHNAIGISMEEVQAANIRKLRARYPEKFDQELAKEENRNREEEMKAAIGEIKHGPITSKPIETISEGNNKAYVQTGQGFAEPPEEKESNVLERIFPEGPGVYRNNWGPGGEVVKLTDEELAKIPKAHQMNLDPAYIYGKSRDARPGEDNRRLGGCECHGATFCPDQEFSHYEDDVPVFKSKKGKDPSTLPQFNTPETYRTTGSVGSISKSPDTEPPEDGWTVARKIANTFVDGQNLAYALKSIDSFEKQRKEYEAGLIEDYVNSPFGDLPL